MGSSRWGSFGISRGPRCGQCHLGTKAVAQGLHEPLFLSPIERVVAFNKDLQAEFVSLNRLELGDAGNPYAQSERSPKLV